MGLESKVIGDFQHKIYYSLFAIAGLRLCMCVPV